MTAGVPLGHEEFHRLAEKLRLRIPKKAFRLGVDQDDLARFLGHHNGVGGRFDGQPKKTVCKSVLKTFLLRRAHRSLAFVHGLARKFGAD
jgi:hypothetical protein